MAGHSKFKNIQHRKGAQDAKRAKIFTKVLREVYVAAKTGSDIEHNARLKTAIASAKQINVPKDRIQAAVDKAANPTSGENYEEMRYEGYGPNGIAVIVEALTDNRNRTASDVRSLFTKSGGSLGETGSVGFLFNRIGQIFFPKDAASENDMFEAAIESGASDCITHEEYYEIETEVENFTSVRDVLEQKIGEPESADLTWKPTIPVDLEEEVQEKIAKLVDNLEDLDDVQNVTTNAKD